MKRKLIFAGNYKQACAYAREKQLGPNQYAVVSHREQVMGLTPDVWEIVRTGTWYENEDVVKCYDYLRLHPRWHEETTP